jgi:hypothetical protein
MSEINSVSFFTPICFDHLSKSWSESLLEAADSYFTLSDERACVMEGLDVDGSKATILDQVEAPTMFSTALKVASYITLVIPLVVLLAKLVLRLTHSFHLLELDTKRFTFTAKEAKTDDEKAESTGIALNNRAMLGLQLFSKDPESFFVDHFAKLSLFQVGDHSIVTMPNIPNQLICFHSANGTSVRKLCEENKLNLLVVPHSLNYELNYEHTDKEDKDICLDINVVERFDLHYDDSAQEELYSKLSNLDETITQLITYIIKGGLSTFTLMSGPILDHDPAFIGNRRIVLLNRQVSTPSNENAVKAIFGDGTRKNFGLIGCLTSEQQIDLVIAEAKMQGVPFVESFAKEIKEQRLEAIKKLHHFYDERGILANPRKPIHIEDLSSLKIYLKHKEKPKLRLSEDQKEKMSAEEQKNWLELTEKSYTMEEAIKDIVAAINEAINNRPDIGTTRGKRNVWILCQAANKKRLSKLDIYRHLGWTEQILKALQEHGHLYELSEQNSDGYSVQA